jgi:hypothetical protein
MPWKDGRGGNVQNVVAAQYTRFGRRLTEVISGGATLAISSTSAVANPMFQVTRRGIDFVVIWHLSSAVDRNAALAGCRTAGPYEEEVHGAFMPSAFVHSSSRWLNVFSGKGRCPSAWSRSTVGRTTRIRRCRGGRILSGSPAKCGD